MNIRDCYKSLQEGFGIWEHLFANQRFCTSDQQITWFEFQDPWLSAIIDASEFTRAVEEGQYSFQLIEDGSIVRLNYSFDERGRSLLNASLAYIAAPSETVFCGKGADVGETNEFIGHCNWIRLDFDPKSARAPAHAACHMHISSMTNYRIPLSRLPSPKQFISWIVSIVNPPSIDQLIERGEHHGLNAPCFVDHWEEQLAPFFHLSIPPSEARGRLAAVGRGR